MKPQGIKTEYTPKGKVKQIIIQASAKTSLVEDLVDTVLYETHKDEPRTNWELLKADIRQKHKEV